MSPLFGILWSPLRPLVLREQASSKALRFGRCDNPTIPNPGHVGALFAGFLKDREGKLPWICSLKFKGLLALLGPYFLGGIRFPYLVVLI